MNLVYIRLAFQDEWANLKRSISGTGRWKPVVWQVSRDVQSKIQKCLFYLRLISSQGHFFQVLARHFSFLMTFLFRLWNHLNKMIPQKQISVIKMSQKILSCKFCGEIFKEARYLERHLMSNKNCRRFRGVLFVCLGCNAFHTTSINEWDAHRELCNSHTTTTEVFQRYQQEISDLKAKY